SNLLRKWFNHDEKKWNEFKRNYFKELDQKSELINVILRKEKEKTSSTITLLYGTKEDKFNNATALREYLEEKIKEYSGKLLVSCFLFFLSLFLSFATNLVYR